MAIKDTVNFTNLLSHDDEPDWKVARYPFTDGGGGNIGQMLPGHLVKFNATADAVLAAVGAAGADDAALAGVIVDIPDNTDVPAPTKSKTVAVALEGSFDKNSVKYQDGTALTTAAVTRLRSINIYLDPATPAGAFAP